jgi:hypothetical protein
MERHRAIIRILKAWAWRVGEPGYAVPLTEALADDVVETVIQNDPLSKEAATCPLHRPRNRPVSTFVAQKGEVSGR